MLQAGLAIVLILTINPARLQVLNRTSILEINIDLAQSEYFMYVVHLVGRVYNGMSACMELTIILVYVQQLVSFNNPGSVCVQKCVSYALWKLLVLYHQIANTEQKIYMQRHMGRILFALDMVNYGQRAILLDTLYSLFTASCMVEDAMR